MLCRGCGGRVVAVRSFPYSFFLSASETVGAGWRFK